MWRSLKKLDLKTKAMLVLIGICLIVTMVIFILHQLGDHTPPVIVIPDQVRQLTDYEIRQLKKGNYKPVLRDVKAIDEEDGDISKRVIVTKEYMSKDKVYCVITYVVMDQAKNQESKKRLFYLKDIKAVQRDEARIIELLKNGK